MKKLFWFVLSAAAAVATLTAAPYSSARYGYSIDLPTGWNIADDSDAAQVVFANAAQDAAVVIGVFETESDVTADDILQALVDRLGMKGKRRIADFKDFCNAAAGSYYFTMNNAPLAADIVVFRAYAYSFMIMGSSLRSSYASNRRAIQAVFDSFTLSEEPSARGGKGEKPVAASSRKGVSGDASREYTLSVGWGNVQTTFTFMKPDYDDAVREGQAIIATGDPWSYYGVDTENDPHYSATFWARFFQDMYNKNHLRIHAMVNWFKAQAEEKGWSSYDLALEVIKCVQAVPYERPYRVVTDKTLAAAVLDYFTPNELAWHNRGDCDSKSMLLIMILRQLGYDLVLFFSEYYEHAMVGINLNARGTSMIYKGKKYYFVEVTYPGWNIGDLPDEFADTSRWTLLPIQ